MPAPEDSLVWFPQLHLVRSWIQVVHYLPLWSQNLRQDPNTAMSPWQDQWHIMHIICSFITCATVSKNCTRWSHSADGMVARICHKQITLCVKGHSWRGVEESTGALTISKSSSCPLPTVYCHAKLSILANIKRQQLIMQWSSNDHVDSWMASCQMSRNCIAPWIAYIAS